MFYLTHSLFQLLKTVDIRDSIFSNGLMYEGKIPTVDIRDSIFSNGLIYEGKIPTVDIPDSIFKRVSL